MIFIHIIFRSIEVLLINYIKPKETLLANIRINSYSLSINYEEEEIKK